MIVCATRAEQQEGVAGRGALSRERVNEMLALHAEGRHEAALAVAEELHARCREDGPVRWWLARLEQERVGEGTPSTRGIVLLDEK